VVKIADLAVTKRRNEGLCTNAARSGGQAEDYYS
jgi:hypothetical protein